MAEHACTHQHVSISAIPPASPVISTDFVPFEATLLFGQAPDWDALANAFYLIQHERRFTSRHHESKCFSYQLLDDSFASHLEEDGSAWVDAAGFFVAPPLRTPIRGAHARALWTLQGMQRTTIARGTQAARPRPPHRPRHAPSKTPRQTCPLVLAAWSSCASIRSQSQTAVAWKSSGKRKTIRID